MRHLPHWGHWQVRTKYVSSCCGWIQQKQLSQSAILGNLPDIAFHVYFWSFIHWESYFSLKCLQQDQKLLNIASLPLPIPSTRNYIILLHSVFNMARILLGNAGLAFLWLFHPLVIILFFVRAPLTGQGFCCTLLTSLWLFHPPGIITCMSMAP